MISGGPRLRNAAMYPAWEDLETRLGKIALVVCFPDTPHTGRIIIREFGDTGGMIVDNEYQISPEEIRKYEGKWIAILNRKIVCGGDTLQETYDKFKKMYKNETPGFDWIPDRKEADTLFY